MFRHELALLLQGFIELAVLILFIFSDFLLPLDVLLLYLHEFSVHEGDVIEDLAY